MAGFFFPVIKLNLGGYAETLESQELHELLTVKRCVKHILSVKVGDRSVSQLCRCELHFTAVRSH